MKKNYVVLYTGGGEQFTSLDKARKWAASFFRRKGRLCAVYEVVGYDRDTGKLKMEER